MKAINIARDGSVTLHEGEEDFWLDEDITWAETEPPQFPGHTIYYDDESLQDPGEVRVALGGVEVPLPAWLVGINGHDVCDPTVHIDEVRKAIKLPS